MMSPFREWETEIKRYCEKNGLDFSKARQMGKCWNKDFLILQYVDEEKGRRGLLDETPAPVVLTVQREADGLRFEQTEHTRKYLAQ